MSTVPVVSVIVPVFNQERFLGRCLRSLLAQDFPDGDYEVIVVDDGSNDGTGHVLDLFRGEIRVLRNEVNSGLPTALNRGIRSSSSLFTVRVDSDDYVNAEFIRVLYTFLAQNRYMDAVACDYFLVDDDEVVVLIIHGKLHGLGGGPRRRDLGHGDVEDLTLIIDSKAFKITGAGNAFGLQQAAKACVSVDCEFWPLGA